MEIKREFLKQANRGRLDPITADLLAGRQTYRGRVLVMK